MSECIPWDALIGGLLARACQYGRDATAKDARLVFAAVTIKHKLCLSDEETVAQIQENPYLQYFAGTVGLSDAGVLFAASLLVEVRKRMGQEVSALSSAPSSRR